MYKAREEGDLPFHDCFFFGDLRFYGQLLFNHVAVTQWDIVRMVWDDLRNNGR